MTQDPYAPPPRHRDSSGGLVRFAILAVLLGAAAWGYASFSTAPRTASLEPAPVEQQMATNEGYAVTTPENAPLAPPPASADTQQAAPRAAAPPSAAEPEAPGAAPSTTPLESLPPA